MTTTTTEYNKFLPEGIPDASKAAVHCSRGTATARTGLCSGAESAAAKSLGE